MHERPLRTDDFDYDLPQELIAQTPVEPRDASRLLVLDRQTGALHHDRFFNIGHYLQPGDLLVANESRVLPARLFGHKPTGGKVEVLLLRRRDDRTWEALVGGKGVRPGTTLQIEPQAATHHGPVRAEVLDALPHGGRLIQFETPIEPLLPELGQMPLPPYIHQQVADPERYQTVYSKTQGSAAAPTAGLHFTAQLIAALQEQGIAWTTVTLHVGLDTFRPVQVEDPAQHTMHSEYFELSAATADAINQVRAEGRRVIAVGTTTVRVLETAAQWAERDGLATIRPCGGDTNIFIYPPYRFRVVDALITNFHLPKSTLLMLVSALASREQILAAYAEAVRERYRFFSFGDAMLIV
ncbi:MAG TPA: tRNA preQ1(34) S-adenosylmethionine ribosyltransferase-isomerase QueA [Herpetosiphonaceae bacterium]